MSVSKCSKCKKEIGSDELKKRMIVAEYRRFKDAKLSTRWRIADSTKGVLMSVTGETITFKKRVIWRSNA